ncbi:MAG: TlyA family RNA methyltransferase [Chloroflexi bacterium]|nr:TlyA family RNA methyltransferase [Chloroflexota bacterium]
MAKIRLDQLLVARGLCESREQAQRLIMSGNVLVHDRPLTKPGSRVSDDAEVRLRARPQYVSRGGEKLAAALDAFAIEPKGWVCADIGASTGGFTDALLQRGAARVYAIDVGYGQLHWRLRQDPRVVVMERTNARHLVALPDPIDLVTIDASFISLKLLLPAARRLLRPQGMIVALIKPQFEAGREQVGKGGVVRDPAVHRRVLKDMLSWTAEEGFSPQDLIPSPLLGPKGNREFLLWLWPSQPTRPLSLRERLARSMG